MAATVYFLAAYLVRSWGSIKSFDWEFNVGWLAASGAAFLLFYFAQAWFWWLLLRGCGAVSPFWPAASVWGKSILARYVPGNVFMFVGRAWMSHCQGTRRRAGDRGDGVRTGARRVRRAPLDGRALPLLGVQAGAHGPEPAGDPGAGRPHAPASVRAAGRAGAPPAAPPAARGDARLRRRARLPLPVHRRLAHRRDRGLAARPGHHRPRCRCAAAGDRRQLPCLCGRHDRVLHPQRDRRP